MIIFKCPKCSGRIAIDKNRVCGCGYQFKVYEGNIYSFIEDFEDEKTKLSLQKWEELYENISAEEVVNRLNRYKDMYFHDTFRQIDSVFSINKSVYLEIGCGEFLFGSLIADKASTIVGIDFSLTALLTAKKLLDNMKIRNYFLVHADINKIPIIDEQIDLIYGGGVIEHFDTTDKVLSEIYRVLKKGGISLNTVPHLNLGALTYRQKWGNIPDMPILKQFFEWIHIRVLKGKHMIFGYEKSFTAGKLRRMHRQAGFSEIRVDKFEVKLLFDFLPFFLKGMARWFSNNIRWFWPMVKAIGKK